MTLGGLVVAFPCNTAQLIVVHEGGVDPVA